MTVICALSDDTSREVWLGCNDGVQFGDTRIPSLKRNKWLLFGSWAVGIAGSGIAVDAMERVREHFPVDETSPLEIGQFMKAVFDEMEFGFRDNDDPLVSYPMSALLAHSSGRVWDMDCYLTLDEVTPGILWARGSGMDFALGADFPLVSKNAGAEERIRNAVEAAIHYNSTCPGQAHVQKLVSIRAV